MMARIARYELERQAERDDHYSARGAEHEERHEDVMGRQIRQAQNDPMQEEIKKLLAE